MATLRDRILNNPSALPVENVEGMGDFRQGLRNALIGAEANTALAEEASARAAGDAATADARAQRVNLLRAQQGMTPLRVGRVENITGVGDVIDWAAGQLGNAAGSMAAPVAGATATAGLGSLLSLAPNAGVRALGRGLRTLGTPAVPFAINAEQMKGEFYGNAKDDPTIMANTSAGDLNNTANLVGAAGGALDAILPTAVARSVAGAGLRQGLRGGGAGRIVGNSLMEGGTELAQGELGRQVRGVLNPEQDTSGFASDRLNEFASGAVGGAPFAAAGEMADAGWRRVGDTASRAADAAGQVAGQVVDLGQSAVERAKERGTEMFGAARGKVVDLKEQLKERTSQAKSQWEATQEEVDLIMGNPPEGMEDAEAFTQWWTQNSGRRAETIMSRLNEMAAAGDEQAGAMLADIEAARNDPNDDGSYDAALDNASEHVLSSMRLSNVAQAAARSGAEAVATKAKDIMASLGKAAWGATLGRKRNAQGGQVDPQADAALELMGNYLATATRPELTRYAVAKGDKSIPNYMRRLGNELSAMAHAGVAVDGKALLHLNRMANHMVGAYGPRAMEVVRELAAMAPPQGVPLIDALVGQVETAAGRAGARATLTLRRQAADALLTALPAEAEQKLLKEGVNLRSDEGKRQLLGMVEALTMGRATPDARGALERLVGAEAVADMIQAIQPAAQETEADAVMFEGQAGEMLTENGLEVTDDGDVIDGEVPSDYAERAAEKNFAKGSGPTYYGFARRPTLNNSQEARDPFGYTERLTKDQMRERLSSGKELPRRPELFKKGETLASGESAAQARAEAMARRLGESRFDIRERRVSEVMDELGLEPVKRLQLFRDYMIQEAQRIEASEGRTEAAEVMRNASKLARAYLLDIMDGVAGGERKAEKFRTTPKEREFVRRQADRYFQTRFMIVAEPMTDQVPEELTPANLKRLASRADAAIASMEVKARKQGLTGEAKDKFVSGEMARENVLEFEPVGGKRKVLYVKADDLVKWARAQRQNSTQSDFSKADTRSESARDREYVSDLMVGVSAMVSSGGVKGLPKLGVQSFENDVPAGLVLPSGRRFVELKAPDVKATTSEEAVAVEQDRDWFVVDDSPPEESSFQAERSEEEALNRAQLRFQNRGSKSESETRSARSRDTLRKLTAEERRERMTSGETREGELDAAFDDQRYRSGTQGFDPTRGRRPVAEDAARATTTPRDLSTPRKFLTELQAFAEATRKLVTGAPDVLSDDPDVAGRYGAKSKRQAAGVIEARKKEFEQFTEALAGFMMDSPFTEKQDALITRLTTEIGNDLGLTSAEEAGARLGKPSGGVYPNRLSELGAKLTDPNLSKFRDRAFTELNKLRGMPAQELYESEPVQALLDELGAMRLRGEDITSYAGALEYTLDTITSANLGAEVEASVTALIAGGTKNTLRRYLAGFSTDPDTPPQIKRIAKAVAMVAGNVEVRVGPLAEGMAGAFDSSDQGGGHIIMTPEDVGLGRAATLLHEGVHAATVAALWKNPALHQAVYDLMEHVGKADPQLGQQYGMTNTLEFVAEGMSNIAFQERLAGVSASSAVQRYLGKTVANAWDAFVGLVKEALGLGDADVNALTQLLELTGRAMKATPKTGVVTTDRDRGYGVLRERVPTSTVLEYIEKMKKAPVVWEDEARGALRAVEEHLKTQDMWDHQTALGIATAEASVRIAPKGSVISGENIVKVLDSIENVIAGSMYMVPRRAPGARNAQTTAGGPQSTPEAQAEAREYIKRVLGPKIKVEFKKLTGYAGEWVEAENAIYISTTPAPGTMQVAYHEALHAFFSKWVSNDQNAKDVLQELADNQAVMRRVRDLIGNDPAALAQLVDGEERLAYIFQFWAAGALQLPYTKPTTLLRKVAKFLRRVSGMVTDTERAVAIFEALHRGDFGKGTAPGAKAMQDALQQGMTSRKAIRKMDRLVQRAAALTLPAESILKNSASKSAQRIGELFFVNPGDDGTGKEAGYLNAREQMTRRYVNEFSRTLDGLQESDYKAVGDYLSRGVELDDITSDIHRRAVKDIRALLKRFRQYMVDERGVDIGDLGDKYYPRVWSLDKLMEKQAEFLKMMATKYPERDGPTILGILTENTASDIEAGRPQNEDGVLTPLNRSGEERVFAWMDPADAAPFLETNMVGVLTRYFHEGVRAAEYTYRFGQKGQKLQELLAKTDNELYLEGRKLLRQGVLANEKAADDWHERQLRDVREAVGAMEGTLGKDISAGWRATNSWVTVYQNIRLLPLSLFASIVDPMGMIARGAEMSEAYEAFKRGITEVGRQWRDIFKEQPTKRQADEWERLAQYVGSVDAAMFESQVGDMYSSVYMSPTAKKWNDTFFKLNGMEAWNRGMRIGATKAAVQFIQRHSTLPTKDSQRWLDELGLQKGDVVLDADGKLLVAVGDIAKAKGISREQAREVAHRLHAGINRWVTGAVLTPNAAQRPAWSSDPHYSMFFHLKQFTYSFHQTILKRAVREGAQGNIAPMMSLFWYVPIMVGADLIKGVIQGGGELPTHMKGMDAGEWLMYGVERSGIMGLGTLGVDAQDDLVSLGGPMVEQIVDAFGDPLERTAIKAMPANPLYREALI